jgi:thiol:disulfide interchange protein DsbD
MRVILLCLALLLPGLSQAANTLFKPIDVQPVFLDEAQAFAFTWSRTDAGEVRLHWRIAPGYYLYQDKLTFTGLDPSLRPALPKGEVHVDDFFGRVEIYRDSLELTLAPEAYGAFRLGWQGCAEAGLCYPPAGADIDLGVGAAAQDSPAAPAAPLAEDQSLAGTLAQHNLALSLTIFFGLGLLLAFTPCSLPMLPILATMVVGGNAGARRGLALAGIYVLSMSVVYAVLGLVAASLGANLQAWLQQPWLLASFAGIFVVLAMPMFGVFELQLPAFVRDRLQQLGSAQQGGSVAGAAALGVLSGLLIGPCMTAPLAGALLYIAQSGNLVHGGLALFALGLGMGVPLLLVVAAGSRFLPKPGAWMERVKRIFGFLFLVAALFIVRPLTDGPLWVALCAFLIISLALFLLFGAQAHAVHARSLRAVGAVALMWGGVMAGGAIAGATDPLRPLQPLLADRQSDAAEQFVLVRTPTELQRELDAAKAAGDWVLIDYYADWCIACKVMDRDVFSQPAVIERLQGVRLLKLDITKSNPASRALLDRFEVLGPPTQVWIDQEGNERRAARITGEVNAAVFLQRAEQVLGRRQD